jgi:hypothetical protein
VFERFERFSVFDGFRGIYVRDISRLLIYIKLICCNRIIVLMENIDWYDFILQHHFMPRNIVPPIFYTRDFIKFKLTPGKNQNNRRTQQVLRAQIQIYNNVKEMKTNDLLNLIGGTSFVNF